MAEYLSQITLVNGQVTGGVFQAIAAADVPLFTSSTPGTVSASGGGTTNFLRADGTWAAPSGGGAVSSVSNSDGSLTISPTTGSVVASINAGHANTWSAVQTFTAAPTSTFGSGGNCERWGASSGNNSATGAGNTCVGAGADASITSGAGNTAFGYQALNAMTSGNHNTAVGYQALNTNTTNSNNTAVGQGAGSNLVAGDGNTMVGYLADPGQNGAGNTMIGGFTAPANNSTTNAIALGYGAVAASNQCAIGATVNTGALISELSQYGINGTNTFDIYGQSSTNVTRPMLNMNTLWVDATDATRKARCFLHAYDTTARECFRWEASGTAPMISFFAVSTTVQYATTGTTTGFTAGAGSTVDSAATFTGNTGSTAYTIGDVVRALKLYGLLTA